jgi:hypothetical protein
MLEAEGMDLTDFVELSGDVAALDAVLPFDLFVDDAGRVRRVNLTIDLETLESMGAAELPPGAKFSMTSTVDFFDFGSDVVVELPQADDITLDLTDSLELLFG